MSRRKPKFFSYSKMVAPAIAAIGVVTLSTMNACSPSDRSTESREETIVQNALEAEAAEANLAKPVAATEVAKVPAQAAANKEKKKVAAQSKPAKAKVEHTPESASTLAAKELAPTTKSFARKPAAAGGASAWVVQVGSFKVKENAEKLQAKLKEAGYSVEMQSIEHSKNGLLHVVRSQPTDNKAEAETMVEDLSAKQDLHAQVLPVSSK